MSTSTHSYLDKDGENVIMKLWNSDRRIIMWVTHGSLVQDTE